MSSALDLGPVVDLLSFDSCQLSRATSSYNAQGVLVVGAPTVTTISCSVQPAVVGGAGEGRNVHRTREGQRLFGSMIMYTKIELLPAKTSGQQSDEITFRGDVYSVVHSEQWDSTSYFRSVLEKKEI